MHKKGTNEREYSANILSEVCGIDPLGLNIKLYRAALQLRAARITCHRLQRASCNVHVFDGQEPLGGKGPMRQSVTSTLNNLGSPLVSLPKGTSLDSPSYIAGCL